MRRKQNRLSKKELADSRREAIIEKWVPKTEVGKKVKAGEIKDIDIILSSGKRILESEIVDFLLPNLEYDLITIGQSKGKFGGGKRSIWKQTQKKTKEGNKPKFATVAVIGNRDGYVGLGHGKAKETVPAREKAIRNAKLNIMKIRRGCGSWACGCSEPHSIPLKIKGKCSSVQVELIPAPKGTNLTTQKEIQKILKLAGVKDVYSKTKGQTGVELNLVKALIKALKNLNSMKLNEEFIKKSGLREGKINE
jgi:small subunit ribosomal protein S5